MHRQSSLLSTIGLLRMPVFGHTITGHTSAYGFGVPGYEVNRRPLDDIIEGMGLSKQH